MKSYMELFWACVGWLRNEMEQIERMLREDGDDRPL